MHSDIDVRIYAAQHPLKSMYPTRQGNLSLRHLGRKMHRHLTEIVSLQNGSDQLHFHRLSKDPFPLLQEPSSSAAAEDGRDRPDVAVLPSTYAGEACSFVPPVS